jgi:hypothetical protein
MYHWRQFLLTNFIVSNNFSIHSVPSDFKKLYESYQFMHEFKKEVFCSVTMCRLANTHFSRTSKVVHSSSSGSKSVRRPFLGYLTLKTKAMRSSERFELLNQQHILISTGPKSSPKPLVDPQVLHKFKLFFILTDFAIW